MPCVQVLIPWAMKEFGLKEVDMQQLCSREDVKKVVLDEMVALGKKSGLFSFEQVHALARVLQLRVAGSGHLPVCGAILGRERSVNANVEEQATAIEAAFPTATRRHVHTLRLTGL
jgi:hypothetical protein